MFLMGNDNGGVKDLENGEGQVRDYSTAGPPSRQLLSAPLLHI
jgi:hypothetical protein